MELPASSAPGNERRPCGRAFPNRRVGRHEVRARALLVCNSCWRAYGTYNVAMRQPNTGEAERLQREGPGVTAARTIITVAWCIVFDVLMYIYASRRVRHRGTCKKFRTKDACGLTVSKCKWEGEAQDGASHLAEVGHGGRFAACC